MNSDRKADYYVGLDMGTGSLGVAVTDPQYHLLKVKGKDFWFVREYETAHPQLERRTHRISKRRLQRHQVRIGLIRSYFADDVLEHDPLFYIRQDNSKYYREDKDSRLLTKDSLFAEPNYGDKEYYKEYPTVFHLRQALLKDEISSEERYSRLLYLAIINMFEYRGHFLLNTDSGDVNFEMVKDAGETVMNYLYDSMEESTAKISYTEVIEILADKGISRSTKKDKISSLLGIKKSNKEQTELVKCLCGMEADARVLFRIEAEEKIKIAFQQASFEDEKEEIEVAVGEDNYAIIEYMKQLYDYSQLQSVLKGFEYLSDARVEMYDKHKEDLILLKKVYKNNLSQEKYNIMFRSSEDGTYSAYCNSLNAENSLAATKKYRRNMKKRGKEDLYARIKKDLKGVEDAEAEKILKEIELEAFLPKQITGANGVIPNQVHRKELKKILENAENHLPFLKEKDSSGYTVSERILMLFSKNIPYYVGPVGKGSQNGWAEIREEGQILPWNMEQKLDMEKTSERFITNLVRECTYLSGEKVLPKQSLLYERYCVLNEINNLQINGKRIVPELKQDIYQDIFMGSRLGKKVTKKVLSSYLLNRGLISDESEISGIDIDHIYPRSLTNDNNIDNNLVLVSKKINQDEKKNDYPLPEKVRSNPKVWELWSSLHKRGFMNDEKYNRLTASTPLTDEQLAGFIARQLVETAQGTKGIADLFKAMMPEAEIVYVKARNVSGFRKQSFLKSRLVNEHHHAKDAYLNIVVGNVYYTKFTRNPMNFIKNEVQRSSNKYNYNLSKMFENDVVRNGEIAWSVQKNHKPGTMQVVSEVMCKNTPLITRQAFEQKGELFNIQPVGKYSAKAGNYVPLKVKDTKLQNVEKYGGYTSLKPAYFTFIEHGSEKKRKRCFEVVQSYYASQIKKESDLIEFLEKNGYKNPRVIAGKIKKNSLIKYNGYLLYVIGMDARKNIEFSNATPMCLENKYIQYVSKLEKAYNEIILSERKKTEPRLSEKVTIENNLKLYRELTDKHVNSIYRNHPRSIGDILEKGEDKFESLDLVHQIKILYNLVLYTSFNRGTFSLTDIGGPKEVGRIRISGNMTEAKELKLIHYSVTGLYKKEIDLLNQ